MKGKYKNFGYVDALYGLLIYLLLQSNLNENFSKVIVLVSTAASNFKRF